MYKIWLTTITLGLVIICSNVAWSQTTFMIKGKVTDNKNEPLIGVNILLADGEEQLPIMMVITH